MSGFEPRISGVRGDHSTSWTNHCLLVFFRVWDNHNRGSLFCFQTLICLFIFQSRQSSSRTIGYSTVQSISLHYPKWVAVVHNLTKTNFSPLPSVLYFFFQTYKLNMTMTLSHPNKLLFSLNMQTLTKTGCRHSSVDSFAPSILPPRVRIPSTPSTLFSI